MKQFEINGILWDETNLKDADGNDLMLDLKDAIKMAKSQGKRLPTIQEIKALIELGSDWDDERKGRMIGGLFFPASGKKNNSTGTLKFKGSNGHYWLYDPEDDLNTYELYLNKLSNYTCLIQKGILRMYDMSVRCVQDIADTDKSKEINPESENYCRKRFIDKEGTVSMENIATFDGLSPMGDKSICSFLYLSDGYDAIRLRKKKDDTDKDFIDKMKILREEIDLFIKHLTKK